MSDKEILELFSKRETRETGFRKLMDTHQQSLYSSIRRLITEHEDANDILQNTFVKAWKGLLNFRSESKLSTWLYRIAYNETINYINSNKKHRRMVPLTEGGDVSGVDINQIKGDQQMDGEEILDKLDQAIETLPDKQRLIFVYRYFDGFTYEKISKITGTSVGGLKASYHHAVKKIELFLVND